MSLSPDQIVDLVQATQVGLIKKKAFLNLRSDLTDYVAVRELYKNHQHQFEGGREWEFTAQVDDNHSARVVGLYEDDSAAIADSLIKGSVGPRFTDANYVFDVHEKALNGGPDQVVDFVYTKYCGMIESHWKLLESLCWGKPESSADKKTPYGIAYWITKGATEGFTGGDPVGFADGRAGISTSAQPRWANWSAPYTNVSKEDLITKMRRAVRKTKFRSPISHAEPTVGSFKNGIYTNDTVIDQFEMILESQNMNLGKDLASMDGRTTFKSRPVVYAPYLDNDSTDPIYLIDWSTLAFGIIKGWKERVSKPQVVAGKHNVHAVFLDASLNLICTDLRRQAVLHKASN